MSHCAEWAIQQEDVYFLIDSMCMSDSFFAFDHILYSYTIQIDTLCEEDGGRGVGKRRRMVRGGDE